MDLGILFKPSHYKTLKGESSPFIYAEKWSIFYFLCLDVIFEVNMKTYCKGCKK